MGKLGSLFGVRTSCARSSSYLLPRESGQMNADWGQRGTLEVIFITRVQGTKSGPTNTTENACSPSQLLQQRRLLRRERCRNSGTPFSGPVEVLQRHECSVDACKLRRHRVVERERYLNSRIIHSVACSHVRKEMLYARIRFESVIF